MKRKFKLYLFVFVVLFAGILVSQTSEPTAWTSWYEFLQFYKTGATTLTNKTLTSPTIAGATMSGTIAITDSADIDTASVNYAYLRNFNYGVSDNKAKTDSMVITSVTPRVDSLYTGLVYFWKADTVNTGAFVVNVDTLGWKAVKKLHDQDPGNSHIEAGSMVNMIFDGTNWQLLTPAAN